jgi:hypothetical protein
MADKIVEDLRNRRETVRLIWEEAVKRCARFVNECGCKWCQVHLNCAKESNLIWNALEAEVDRSD